MGNLIRRSRWPLALILWGLSAFVMVAAPAWALPVNVGDGITFSWGQLLVVAGLAVAWGDMRRKVEDLRDEVKRLPCRSGDCPKE
jgi:hypothetical protein